jgi:hypothetical protein
MSRKKAQKAQKTFSFSDFCVFSWQGWSFAKIGEVTSK